MCDMKGIRMNITFEFATQDDCLDKMVPSDLRTLVAERDSAQKEVKRLQKFLGNTDPDKITKVVIDWTMDDDTALITTVQRKQEDEI